MRFQEEIKLMHTIYCLERMKRPSETAGKNRPLLDSKSYRRETRDWSVSRGIHLVPVGHFFGYELETGTRKNSRSNG